jgi:Hint module
VYFLLRMARALYRFWRYLWSMLQQRRFLRWWRLLFGYVVSVGSRKGTDRDARPSGGRHGLDFGFAVRACLCLWTFGQDLEGKTNPVRASSVKVGDVLQAESAEGISSGARVTKIASIQKTGLYAPLTPSGRLVVDGVAASSYIALDDTEEYMDFGGFLRLSHHTFVHLTLAPFRVVCMGINDKPCHVYDQGGMPFYVRWGIDLIQDVANGNQVLVKVPLLALILSVQAAFLGMEYLFGATVTPLIVLFLAIFTRRRRAQAKTKTV